VSAAIVFIVISAKLLHLMKHLDYNAPSRSRKHVLMVALCCLAWFGCSGCASTSVSDETIPSDKEYQRQREEQREIDHDILKPGTVIYSP
jgi:hypothetical protein